MSQRPSPPTHHYPCLLRWACHVALLHGLVRAAAATSDDLSSSPTAVIRLDGQAEGRVFEGLGALSAGASSRLLIDYPEPQRSEILDFLFRPKFGAGFQHLKVEVGGDINSTDGCEPSHQRTRDDLNFERGYEWWLMREARKRNPAIILDCLQWGAPAWVGNGHLYSLDNAEYLVRYLEGARRVHGLDIQYAGSWNETRVDTGWLKLFRQTLDAHQLQSVQIVAADEINNWSIVDVMATDPELEKAIAVVGVHYPKFQSTAAARLCGKPLWSSEDGPWKGTWEGAAALAKLYNRNYGQGRMTKTIVWSPVTAYYDNLPLPGSGVMYANQPWSGAYATQPALWATAHTTQFAAPGWRYLEGGACTPLPEGGSCVTLKSTNGTDYSVILETIDARVPQLLRFEISGGLAPTPLQVWRSNPREQFVRQSDVLVRQGSFNVRVEPGSLCSLTTTAGQTKGQSAPPPPRAFPLPYSDDFEAYRPGTMPRYFSDQAGIFEVVTNHHDSGRSLQQVITRKGIEWHLHLNPDPETFLGDLAWRDYEVAVDVALDGPGFVSLFGRVGTVPQKAALPEGYWLKLADTGYWELGNVRFPLASGRCGFRPGELHRLALRFQGDRIEVRFDGRQIGEARNTAHAAGMIGLGSGWHTARFDNLAVTPLPSQ